MLSDGRMHRWIKHLCVWTSDFMLLLKPVSYERIVRCGRFPSTATSDIAFRGLTAMICLA